MAHKAFSTDKFQFFITEWTNNSCNEVTLKEFLNSFLKKKSFMNTDRSLFALCTVLSTA